MGHPGALFDGGSTSFGAVTITTTFDGGSSMMQVTLGSKLLQTFIFPNRDSTQVTGSGDLNLDGTIDMLYTSSYDGTTNVTTTVLSDSNYDGVFDTQDVWVVDVSQGTPFQMAETYSRYLDADGGLAGADAGVWTVISTIDGGGAEPQADGNDPGCNDWAGFPAPDQFTGNYVYVDQAVSLIRIAHSNSYPGACNDQQTAQLVTAFQEALDDIQGCLGSLDPTLSSSVYAAATAHPLTVACSDSCSTDWGITATPYAPLLGPVYWLNNYDVLGKNTATIIAVNPTLAFYSPIVTEEVVLHELLHAGGELHNPQPLGDPPGHDRVFACGRYCVSGGAGGGSGCQGPMLRLAGVMAESPADYAFDCVDCADNTPIRQVLCGAGYGDPTGGSCSSDICTEGCSGDVCCNYQLLNCWANGAEDLGTRDPHMFGKVGICNQTDCGMNDNACCNSSSNPLNLEACDGLTPCNGFPIGPWCSG